MRRTTIETLIQIVVVILLIIVFFLVRKLRKERDELLQEVKYITVQHQHKCDIIHQLDNEITSLRSQNSEHLATIDTMDEYIRAQESTLVLSQTANANLMLELEDATKP